MDPPLPPRLARNVDVGPQVLFRVGADPQFAEVFPPQRGRAHDGTDDRRDKVTEVLITEARRITVPTFPARTIEELLRQLEPSQEFPVVRSVERRVGKVCSRKCKHRWQPYHYKNKIRLSEYSTSYIWN